MFAMVETLSYVVLTDVSTSHCLEGAEARSVSLAPLPPVLALLALLERLAKRRHLAPFRSADLSKTTRLYGHSNHQSSQSVLQYKP